MKIAVTGGRGNIGQCVLRELQRKGWTYSTLGRSAVPETLQAAGGEHIVGAITDAGAVKQLVNGAQVLMHLARTTHKLEDVCEHDFHAMQVIIPAAVANNLEFVFTSSQCVHGSADRLPAKPVPEDGPLTPNDPYGVMKLAWEKMLGVYQKRQGLRFVVYRFPAVIPAELKEDHFIARFLKQARQTGRIEYAVPEAAWLDAGTSLVQAEDAARVMVNNIGRSAVYGRTFMVCEDAYLSWRRLAELSRDVLEAHGIRCELAITTNPAARRPSMEYPYDNTAARKALGYIFAPDLQALRDKLMKWWETYGRWSNG